MAKREGSQVLVNEGERVWGVEKAWGKNERTAGKEGRKRGGKEDGNTD